MRKAGIVWRSGKAIRFPGVAVTIIAAKNNAGKTYAFNGRVLVEAIQDGTFGEIVSELWRSTPIHRTTADFELVGIFRVLDRRCFDFEIIHVPTVMERDGWRCHICSSLIDPGVTFGPEKYSLDHVMPIARGGGHTYDNVKATHWRCNLKKGHRPPDPQP